MNSEISQQLATATITRDANSSSSSSSSSNHNDYDEDDEPRLLDFEDLPISGSESDQELRDRQSPPPDNVHHEQQNSNPVASPDSSVGSSEPNTLTKLIATRESQLRKLASIKQPSRPKHKEDERAQLRSKTTTASARGHPSSSGK